MLAQIPLLTGQLLGQAAVKRVRAAIPDGFEFTLLSGRRVLVGPRFAFPRNLQDGLLNQSAEYVQAAIAEMCTRSDTFIQRGLGRLLKLHGHVTAFFADNGRDGLIGQIRALHRAGRIIIVIIDDVVPPSEAEARVDLESLATDLSTGNLAVSLPEGSF